MTNKEKIEMLKKWLTEHDVSYCEPKKFLNLKLALYLPKHGIPIFDDEEVDGDEAFRLSSEHKHQPFFVRTSESPEFIIEKITNMITLRIKRKEYNEQRRKAKALHLERQQKIEEFKNKGVWAKIDKRVKRNEYHGSITKFYDEFIERQNSQFAGDFDKTAQSYVDKFDAKFKPKPKRKRIHFVAVKPHSQKV